MYRSITQTSRSRKVVQYQRTLILALNIQQSLQHSTADRKICLPSVLVFWMNGISFLSNYCCFFHLFSPLDWWQWHWGKNPAIYNKTTSTSGRKTTTTHKQTSVSNCVNLTPGSLTFWLQRTVYNLYLDMHMWIFWRSFDVFFFSCLYFFFFLMVCKSI